MNTNLKPGTLSVICSLPYFAQSANEAAYGGDNEARDRLKLGSTLLTLKRGAQHFGCLLPPYTTIVQAFNSANEGRSRSRFKPR